MNKLWMPLAASLFAIGCTDKGDTGGSDTDDTTVAEADFSDSWGSSSLDLNITNGDAGASYYFGTAETGCDDPDNCWYGEDCIYGDLTGLYFYCHPASVTGVSLAYGGDYANLNEGSETVYTDSSFEPNVTYYVEDAISGSCWIWGDDTSYYAGLGCDEI